MLNSARGKGVFLAVDVCDAATRDKLVAGLRNKGRFILCSLEDLTLHWNLMKEVYVI